MITLIYDRYNFNTRQPYPNGWHTNVYDYADTLNTNEYFDLVRQNFKVISSHSELMGNVIHRYGGSIVYSQHTKNYTGDKLFYPIEIYGSHNEFLEEEDKINQNGIIYNTGFINVVSKESIELAKENKLIYVINTSHEPFSDFNFLQKFPLQLEKVGLSPSNFIIFGGSSNLLELYPELKETKYTFYFEDDLLISSCRKVEDLKSETYNILGYESTYIQETEIETKRNKYFICPNRNSNKHHRFSLGCYFEYENMWDKLYASFLCLPEAPGRYCIMDGELEGIDLIKNIREASKTFAEKLPMEMDTHLLPIEQKTNFESMRSFKKELYLDSYIHIITETNFKKDIFPTEKLINPMVVLQPFILFGAPNYLKYIKSLGFKTFDGFIDESYDNEFDDGKRFQMLCNELKRLSNLSLDEIHNWYISIIPILKYNREYCVEFAKKHMFIENLKNHL
jgi:hypothetical protein